MAESFQEVELGLPQFSDTGLNGDGLETASAALIKSEATEEQSQTKTAPDKGVSSIVIPHNEVSVSVAVCRFSKKFKGLIYRGFFFHKRAREEIVQ